MNTYRLCCYIYCRSVDYFACIAVKRQWNSAVAERSRHCFILREWNQKPDAPLWCFWTAGMENVSFFSFFFSIKPVCFVRRGDITAFGRLSDRIRTTEGVNNNKRWCPGTRGTVSDGVLTSVGKKKKKELNAGFWCMKRGNVVAFKEPDVAWEAAAETAACNTKWIPVGSQRRELIEQQAGELGEDLTPLHVCSCLMSWVQWAGLITDATSDSDWQRL